MSSETIIQLVISFLGAGTVVALIDWVRTERAEKRQRQAEYVSAQLQHLYGPLFFFTSQNNELFRLNKNIQEAYDDVFIKPDWSDDAQTQKKLEQDTKKTLDLANEYMRLVEANNEKLVGILVQNFSYIDPDDTDFFQSFLVDFNRMKTEVSQNEGIKTPSDIYRRLGGISFMRPEFIDRVRSQFLKKKNRLNDLH